MSTPTLPPDEAVRLEVLRSYGILDTPPEQAFDDLTALAAAICGTPIALISLVDEARQWFKSRLGIDMAQTPREVGFCPHAILQDDVLVVPDTLEDERFADNPLVTGGLSIRFYAGAPLIAPGGQRLGTLCVIDRVPRSFDAEQMRALQALARQVITQLELRRRLAERERMAAELEVSEERFRDFFEHANDLLQSVTPEGHFTYVNRAWRRALEYDDVDLEHLKWWHVIHPADEEHCRLILKRVTRGEDVGMISARFITRTGRTIEVEGTVTCRFDNGVPVATRGIFRDVTRRKQAEAALHAANEELSAVLRAASAVALIATTACGKVTLFNTGAERMLGWKAEELVGRCTPEILHAKAEIEARAAELSARYGKTVQGFDVFAEPCRRGDEEEREWTYVRKDRSTLTVTLAVTALRDQDGMITGFLGIAKDITAQKHSQEALRASEEQLQRVLEGSNDGFWDWNVVTGEVRFSDRLVSMLGYTHAEMPGHVTSWQNLIHPDDVPHVEGVLRRHLDGATELYETEHRLRCKDGEWMWILDRGKVVTRHADGTPLRMAGTHTDISKRKQAEMELSRFFNLSLELLCIATMDGYFKRVNPAFEQLLGYTVEELTRRPLIDFVHPDDRARTIEEIAAGRDGVRTARFESRYICRDGSVKWIAWTASPVAEESLIYAAGRDITEARRANQWLRENEARTRSIIDNSITGLVTTDIDGKISSMNPAAERMFGHAPGALIGESIARLLPRQEMERLRSIRATSVGRVTQWTGRRSNEELFPCEVSLFEFTAAGRTQLAAHVIDVSERFEIERLKNDFVSTVSHELRTPLTSIRGSLGLLASGAVGELTPAVRDMVAVAERNSTRLIALINDILDFEKLESGKMEMDMRPTTLARVVQRSVESVATFAAQEAIRIAAVAVEGTVYGDEECLTQVLVNLLSNAIKFSPRGSTVTVTTAERDGLMELRVIDTGRGIPERALPMLFQRFKQIDSSDSRKKGGTGLGLAICKAIAEQHGGVVGVESREGVGSAFWVRIPSAIELGAPAVGKTAVLVYQDHGELVAALAHALEGEPCVLLPVYSFEDVERIVMAGLVSVAIIDVARAEERLWSLAERAPAVSFIALGDRAVVTPRQLAPNVTFVMEPSDQAAVDEPTGRVVGVGPAHFLIKGRSGGEELRTLFGQVLNNTRMARLHERLDH